MKDQVKILVVDDEPGIRDLLSYELSSHDYTVITAENGEEALEKARKDNFNLVISDVKMPRLGGLEMLEAMKKINPDIEVIMSTGYGTIETAVSAMKMGAYDFVQKPFDLNEILAIIDKALERSELKVLLGVYEASKNIFSSIKLEELLPVMAGLSTRILKADDVSIMLADGEGRLVVRATAGLSDDKRAKTRLALGERVAGRVAQGAGPVIIDGPLEGDARFTNIDTLREIRSAIVFPLVMEGRLLGILNANRTVREAPFTGSDLRYASVFCSQISQAIHNATLYRELDDKMREIEKMQAHLVESEKLAAIGKLAAGVAHEINNPLTGIMGFAELMLQSKDLSASQREDVASILQQSQRCRKIVQNLLQFSRKKKGNNEAVDLRALLEVSLQVMKYDLMRENIEVQKYFPEDLPVVQGDPAQLEQVYLNLLGNARQAMEGKNGGLLKISASRKDGLVVLRVEDTGCGIPPENLGKVFDPFFTTKPVGQGTGLGLSISYGIIQQHHGTIRVESQPGIGTAFIISLPVTGAAAPQESGKER
ncbi:MAG: response regulator [Elusimicrobiales bacterium]|jgi:signal transduction histidine kinase